MSLVSAAELAIVHALGSLGALVLVELGNLWNVRGKHGELEVELPTLFFSEDFTKASFGLFRNGTNPTYLVDCATPSQEVRLSAVCI
jgi:hypothetical protein